MGRIAVAATLALHWCSRSVHSNPERLLHSSKPIYLSESTNFTHSCTPRSLFPGVEALLKFCFIPFCCRSLCPLHFPFINSLPLQKQIAGSETGVTQAKDFPAQSSHQNSSVDPQRLAGSLRRCKTRYRVFDEPLQSERLSGSCRQDEV